MKYNHLFSKAMLCGSLALLIFISNCMAQPDTIHWNEKRPLQWADFAGPVDSSYNGDALTAATISYETYYKGDVLKFNVRCYFNKSQSWTKQQEDTLLKHEQGHFDITEIFARQLRKDLDALPQEKISKKTLDDIFKKMMSDKKRKQQLYDQQTNSSLNRQEQMRWNKLIKDELQQLAAFAY